jgi:small subunit ribosomal protein S20
MKKGIKLQIKKVIGAAEEGNLEQGRQELKVAVKKLDKAAAKRVLHPNTAARKKSQLARLLGSKQAVGQP